MFLKNSIIKIANFNWYLKDYLNKYEAAIICCDTPSK